MNMRHLLLTLCLVVSLAIPTFAVAGSFNRDIDRAWDTGSLTSWELSEIRSAQHKGKDRLARKLFKRYRDNRHVRFYGLHPRIVRYSVPKIVVHVHKKHPRKHRSHRR